MKVLLPFLLIVTSVSWAKTPDRPALYELARHLYRWHMDEDNIDGMIRENEVIFYVRDIPQDLDDDDQSKVVDVLLGGTGFGATMKLANYSIPELKLEVKSEGFKVNNVFVFKEDPEGDESFTKVSVPYKEMVDYLFRTRAEMAFPDEAMLDKLRTAVREPMKEVIEKKGIKVDGAPETLHLASVSPVANELWVLWERDKVLLRYASDFDLNTDAAWEHPDHAITIYDLDDQVVVSLHEVPGSNAYITRDMAGRALFNCVILGKRIEVIPVIRN